MRRILLIIMMITTYGVMFGQISNMHDATGNPLMTGSYDKVEGSPYVDDGNWNTGTIILQTDKYLTNEKIRYNAYEDELQYLNNGNPFYYANQDVKSFEFSITDKLGNIERYFFSNGFEYEDEISKKNFIRVLYNGGKIKVLSKISARKQKMTPASYGEPDYDKFIITYDSYIWKDGVVQELKLSRNKIAKLFPSIKNSIQSYFKENVVDLDSSKDIEDLFEYIESELEM